MATAPWRTQWWKDRPQPSATESWTIGDRELEQVDGFRILQDLIAQADPPKDPVSLARSLVYLPVLDALPVMDRHPPLPEAIAQLSEPEKNVLQVRLQALIWTKFLHRLKRT